MGERAKQLAYGLADMSGCEVEIPQKRGLGGSKTKNVYRSSDQERLGKKEGPGESVWGWLHFSSDL